MKKELWLNLIRKICIVILGYNDQGYNEQNMVELLVPND